MITQNMNSPELFALLCRAAGVDHLKVREIECRCAVKEPVKFSITLLGEPERIAEALLEDATA